MLRERLRSRMRDGEMLAGTFIKTPSIEVVEVLARAGLDFVALDAEHAPFDRGRMDACLAIAKALDLPALVRVAAGEQSAILQALDAGAVGVVVPHVDSTQKATNVARWSRFGHGGRGYAGSTRWAGYATRPMSEILEQSQRETVVIAQIEEPEGVEDAEDIAATEGLDGLFVGPADLSVCLGKSDLNSEAVTQAMSQVGRAAARHGKCFATFSSNTESVARLKDMGVTMLFIASEQAFMLSGAKTVVWNLTKSNE